MRNEWQSFYINSWRMSIALTDQPRILFYCTHFMMTTSNGNISVLLALCEGNPPVTGGFHWQRPVTLMFSLICAWTICWANNGDVRDLRRHRAHYGVTVMLFSNANSGGYHCVSVLISLQYCLTSTSVQLNSLCVGWVFTSHCFSWIWLLTHFPIPMLALIISRSVSKRGQIDVETYLSLSYTPDVDTSYFSALMYLS